MFCLLIAQNVVHPSILYLFIVTCLEAGSGEMSSQTFRENPYQMHMSQITEPQYNTGVGVIYTCTLYMNIIYNMQV